ncbi:MAG: hypothetical protein QMC95_03135 [Desulfitobacteriaceae bacterium]|nr:hypothetical protein [Desulfitobacteriaceae bacterium]MDI6913199.1 hypothetical protein [Desulfitobacteriaceae bacterium]
MGHNSRLKQNILIWGLFSLIYLGTVNTIFAGLPYSSFYSALIAIIPSFILDRYLRRRKVKKATPTPPTKGRKASSKPSTPGKKKAKKK